MSDQAQKNVGGQELQDQIPESIQNPEDSFDTTLSDPSREEDAEGERRAEDASGSRVSEEPPVEKKKGKLRGRSTAPTGYISGPHKFAGPPGIRRPKGPGDADTKDQRGYKA